LVSVCDGRKKAERGTIELSSRLIRGRRMFRGTREEDILLIAGDTRSEDGGQGRCSCAFIEAKRRPLTVATAKGTSEARPQAIFAWFIVFNMFTSRRSRALSSFPNGHACKRRMRQAIDFSHVDVCRHLERARALHSYPTGDDVSLFHPLRQQRCSWPGHGCWMEAGQASELHSIFDR